MVINLNTIGVDRKKTGFTQVYNKPIQDDLKDLGAIGLLTYLISLPDDWKIRKIQLHNTFSRRRVESAWQLLVEKGYAIDISFFVTGKKGRMYFYRVSDESYTQEDFTSLLRAVLNAVKESGQEVNLSSITTMNAFDLPKEICDVQNVQYKKYSTKRTSTNKQETKKDDTNKQETKDEPKEEVSEDKEKNETPDVLSIDNYQDLEILEDEILKVQERKSKEAEQKFTDACNELYSTFAIGRWSKKQWNIIVKKFVTETIESKRYLNVPDSKISNYCRRAIEIIANNSDYKRESHKMLEEWAKLSSQSVGKTVEKIIEENKGNPYPFYNWLENRK